MLLLWRSRVASALALSARFEELGAAAEMLVADRSRPMACIQPSSRSCRVTPGAEASGSWPQRR
jgi:hypothetical protein